MDEYTWAAKRVSDGQSVQLRMGLELLATPLTDPPVDPPTPPVDTVLVPEGTNAVKLGATVLKVDHVNPTSTDFPGGRGTNELVIYTPAIGPVTRTNQYGVEVVVGSDSLVHSISDRESYGKVDGTAVPVDGYVISGHGTAGEALLAAATVGGPALAYKATEMPPGPQLPPSGNVTRESNIAVWVMMWPNSPKATPLDQMPASVDEIRVSFAINDGQLVGDGPYGFAEFQRQCKGFLSARSGRFISIAVGGGGYTISIPSVDAYIKNIKAIEMRYGFTFGGINWDWESSDFKKNATNCVAVSRAFRAERPNFYVSWSPNGTFKGDYAAVCQANPDVVDELGFQNYDTPVDYKTATDVIDLLQGTSLKPAQMGAAMMIGAGANYWTLQTCINNAARLRADKGIRKVALWEGGNSEATAWYAAMQKIVR